MAAGEWTFNLNFMGNGHEKLWLCYEMTPLKLYLKIHTDIMLTFEFNELRNDQHFSIACAAQLTCLGMKNASTRFIYNT